MYSLAQATSGLRCSGTTYIAEFSIGGKIIRPAAGYLGPNGVVRVRPPSRDRSKQQLTLRLDPDVIEKIREGGPDWQVRMNEALRKAVGL